MESTAGTPEAKVLPGPGKYIPELDGIRAIAVWMVVSLHLSDTTKLSDNVSASIPQWLASILGHGWLGVDLFFILSGFLITGILLDSREKPGYFRNFYARRFLRIIPLYFTVIAVMWVSYRYSGRYFMLCCFSWRISSTRSVPARRLGPRPSGRWPLKSTSTSCGPGRYVF